MITQLQKPHLQQRRDDIQVQPWYRLTFEQTRIQLLLRTRRWPEALDALNACIVSARDAKLHSLLTAFQLASSEALADSNAIADLDSLPINDSHVSWPLGLVGSFHATLGKALSSALHKDRGASHRARAVRVLEGAGDLMAAKQVAETSSAEISAGATTPTSVAKFGHLDSAVTLLELSGHPHILGREAFATLQDSGCAEALALGARSPRGVRLVESDGWNQADALAALRAAARGRPHACSGSTATRPGRSSRGHDPSSTIAARWPPSAS